VTLKPTAPNWSVTLVKYSAAQMDVENRRLLCETRTAGESSSSHSVVAAPAAASRTTLRSTGVELSASGVADPFTRIAGGSGDSDQGSEADANLFAQVDSLIKPVSATMLLVVGLVGVLNASPVAGSLSSMMVYEEAADDSVSTKLAGSFENASIFIALIVGVTTALFLLYKFHCTRLIYAWLMTSVGMLLASFGGLVA
jgi:hypothetical protein